MKKAINSWIVVDWVAFHRQWNFNSFWFFWCWFVQGKLFVNMLKYELLYSRSYSSICIKKVNPFFPITWHHLHLDVSEILKQVWDLSDQDNDSMLSLKEFCTALYLMERFREGRPLPVTLPGSILPDEALFSTMGRPTTPHGTASWAHVGGMILLFVSLTCVFSCSLFSFYWFCAKM